jgi:death-on-curing protein
MIHYISLADAIYIVERLGFYVKDAGLLDSALSRPATEVFGVEAYPTIALKTAAMQQSLVKNHSLIDGNKRTSWVLVNAFVELNNYELVMTADQGFDLTLGVAEGRYELQEAAAIIEQHLKEL